MRSGSRAGESFLLEVGSSWGDPAEPKDLASATTGGGIGLKPGVELTEHSKDKQGWPPHIHIPETGDPVTFHMDPQNCISCCVCVQTRLTSRGDRSDEFLIRFLWG